MARSRSFDADTVIERCTEVFRAKGYRGTSIQDLVKATGLLKGSLYAAFESKEKLFRLALEHEATRLRRQFIKDEPPMEYLREHFRRLVNESTGSTRRHGCLTINTCVEPDTGEHSGPADAFLKEYEKNFAAALRLARDRGELPADAKIDVLAQRLLGAAFAIRQMARCRDERKLFMSIANGVLNEVGIEI